LFTTVTSGAAGPGAGLAIPDPVALVQPPTVCVTVYVPATETVIDEIVAPFDHKNEPLPLAVKTELPQLSVTVTIGVDGITIGAATPDPAELIQVPNVCVTVYVPAEVTVIDEEVAPVDQTKLVPVALKTELPQLFVTYTIGADGTDNGAAIPDPAELTQPLTV
jgi:hypothetical protein